MPVDVQPAAYFPCRRSRQRAAYLGRKPREGANEMNVLITGADGYIGAVLGPFLMERGHNVAGLDSGFYRNGWLFDDGRRRPPVMTKDIRQIDAADVVDFDAIVHLAEL